MMCVMALKSSEDTARRVARMHLAAAQQGKVQGRIAYGWIRSGPDKGRHLPEEASVVRALFAGCLIGETAYSLAAGLNARGIPAPQADRWSSTTVNKMLRNPRYAGMASYGGKHRIEPALEWDGWSHVLFDDDGHPLLGNWDPIIDPKDWSRVQFELQLRRQASGIPAGSSRPPVTPKYLLSGILRCGKCGRGLVSNLDRKKKYRTYRCPPSAHGGCGGIHIAADTTEKAVERALTTYFEQLLATMRHQHRHDDTAQDTQLTNTRSALAAEHARKQDLMRRWADNTLSQTALTEDDFFQLIHAINKKIATLQDFLAAAEASTPTTAPPSRRRPVAARDRQPAPHSHPPLPPRHHRPASPQGTRLQPHPHRPRTSPTPLANRRGTRRLNLTEGGLRRPADRSPPPSTSCSQLDQHLAQPHPLQLPHRRCPAQELLHPLPLARTQVLPSPRANPRQVLAPEIRHRPTTTHHESPHPSAHE